MECLNDDSYLGVFHHQSVQQRNIADAGASESVSGVEREDLVWCVITRNFNSDIELHISMTEVLFCSL